VAVGPAGLRVLPDDDAAAPASTWPATVVESVFRPRGIEVTLDVEGPVGVERLVAVAGAAAPEPGARVRVALDAAGCAVAPTHDGPAREPASPGPEPVRG
jgi:hypothetical protein